MFKLVGELFFLLTPEQRDKFYILQVLVVFVALAEVFGVASVGPFMALVGDLDMLTRDNFIADVYVWSGITTATDFLFVVGLVVLSLLFLATMLSMFTVWKLSMFAAKVGSEIGNRLFVYYLQQDLLYHSEGSSSQLTKQIAVESARVTDGVIQPLMQMNARIILVLLLSSAIFIFNPYIAISGVSIFLAAYFILFKAVRKRLKVNGEVFSEVSAKRFGLMNESFGGIKDVMLLGRKQDFISRFECTGDELALSKGTSLALGLVPRYFMEFMAFGAMIGLVLYLVKIHDGDVSSALPVLSVYALAAFKLLPGMQQIYSNLALMRANISAFESIKDDLKGSLEQSYEQGGHSNEIEFTTSIKLKGICFQYPSKSVMALNNVSIEIPVNSVVGVVGSSGSGKSTLIDVLLGLIKPLKGGVEIDSTLINQANLRSWQDKIGFVPQSIFLGEGTIAQNVAFGVSGADIDMDKVASAIKLAHLEDMVNSLEKGLSETVGERGVQLSGGQRQRIGIARALYDDASVLVFDEATSALDGVTEKLIMDAVHDFSGSKTIIMIAHRLKTVEKCDVIFFMDKGRVVDSGTYQQLMERNPEFKRMAQYA